MSNQKALDDDTLTHPMRGIQKTIDLRMQSTHQVMHFIEELVEIGEVLGPINYTELEKRIADVRQMLRIMPVE